MISITRVATADIPKIAASLRSEADSSEYESTVKEILSAVASNGDESLIEYTEKFDGIALTQSQIRVSAEEIETAFKACDEAFKKATRHAAANVRAYHERQLGEAELLQEGDILTGRILRPLRRVGVYVPGGRANYPSTVLMTVLPARVAGVKEIALCIPPDSGGSVNKWSLAVAAELGLDEVYRVGGAQAIAALAYGTQTIREVDKIVGPGNRFVTLAKKLVFGNVDIDMLAGPSEVVVIADADARPSYVALDMLAQAEHATDALAILVTTSQKLAGDVVAELERVVNASDRQEILVRSITEQARAFIVNSPEDAFAFSNEIAPEHLGLALNDALDYLELVENAGAVFLGHFSPEALGDYIAGPSHVLPTAGTARFASPLSVEHFLKSTSVVSYGRRALADVADSVIRLAEAEGLSAHADSIRVRLREDD